MREFAKQAVNEFRELWENRFRIWTLCKNDLKMEFGQSKLGFFWSLLEPLGIVLIYAIIFPLILDASFYSWVLFFIVGYIPHRFLSEGMQNVTESMVKDRSVLNQIDIKEEVVPIASGLANLIKFLIECIAFFSVVFISGVLPGKFILIFPFLVLIEFLIVLGFGMHLSVTYIDMRDLDHILNVFFQALFFLTPIVYRVSRIPADLQGIYLLNPISRLILLYQNSVLSNLETFTQTIPPLKNLLLMGLFALVVFSIGYASFKRRKSKYVGQI